MGGVFNWHYRTGTGILEVDHTVETEQHADVSRVDDSASAAPEHGMSDRSADKLTGFEHFTATKSASDNLRSAFSSGWAFEDLFRTFREESDPRHVVPPHHRISPTEKHAALLEPALALAFRGTGRVRTLSPPLEGSLLAPARLPVPL